MTKLKARKTILKMCRSFLCILLVVGSVMMLSGCEEVDVGKTIEGVQGKNDGGAQAVAAKQRGKNCWVCPLFQLGFNTGDTVVKGLIPKVAKGAVPLLAVGFGLWLAIRVWKLIGSMRETDAAGFWKDVGTQAFWATICAGMLKNIMWVVTEFIEPVFVGFVDFAVAVVASLPIQGGNISCPQGNPQSAFICLLTAMQEKLNVGLDVSLVSMIFGDLVMIVMGVGGYLMSVIMGFYFPMLLMDGVFRYMLVLCFLPLAVVAMCFKATRRFAFKVSDALISIGLQIVGLSIFVALAAGVLTKYLDDYAPMFKNPMGFINNIKELEKVMDGSPGLIGFIFVCFFLVLFAGVVMDIMAIFGGLSPSDVAGGAFMAMKNVAKQGQKAATFSANRVNRIKDRKAKKVLESGTKDRAKFETAKARLEERGYLKSDGKGGLYKTQAYNDMDKRGARAFLGRVQQDLQASGTAQSQARAGDSNKMGDKVNDEVEKTIGGENSYKIT